METTSLTFGAPLWLWGLATIPLLAGLFLWSHARGRKLVARIVAARLRDQLAGSVSTGRRVIRAILLLSAWALLFIALAQPRSGFIEREQKTKGRDVIVAIDTSRSMLATDVPPTRLARAKLLTQDLVRLLRGDRVGLVAFAGSAFLQAPLTLDYGAVLAALDELDTNVIPKGGTNIAAAIRAAEEAFGKAEGQVRALIILTDGEELDADGIAAAAKAKELGIRIFTVGIGSPEGSLIPVRTEDGRQDFVRDASGKPVQSKLDETRLREIADATGGFYLPLGPDTARELFQSGIEPLDRVETGVFASRQPIEQYQWPLGAAMACMILWMLIGERKRRVAGAAAFAVALFSILPANAQSTGLEAYQSGNFEAAREEFNKRLGSSPQSDRLQFNAGAASYKLGDFEQAISHFTDALLSEDRKLREDAAYNLANSLVRRGEAAQDNKVKRADWESAIEKYDDVLQLNPANKSAEENRDVVRKLIEELDRQEQQQNQQQQNQQQQNQQQQNQQQQNQQQQNQQQQNQQQQNQQQQNQQQQNQQQQNQQQQNQQQQNQQQQNQQQQNQQQQNQQQQNQQQQNQQQQNQQQQNQQQQNQQQQNQQQQNQQQQKGRQGEQAQPSPAPTPGERKEGEIRANNAPETKQEGEQQPSAASAAEAGEEEVEGQMSQAQARSLLNALRSEEEKVNLMFQQSSQEVLRDW
ncbi:MAG: VWA domain-containing protein [Terrimicrobiaceae bacterium]|nr:VWA domain-containing protein [Terrimicrobiaceae bacterium]